MIADLHRHDRVWLAATDDRSAVAAPSGSPRSPADPRVALWIAAGRAFVVRRRDAASPDDGIPVAIALPLAEDRVRIALVVPRRAIVRVAPPLALAEVIAAAPAARRAALADLVARGAALDTTFAVYGSFAWQAISGEPCVTAESDLDLLWSIRDAEQAGRVIDLLLHWEREHGLRADGEARFADGDAVAWRELASATRRVLVKRDGGVALRPASL